MLANFRNFCFRFFALVSLFSFTTAYAEDLMVIDYEHQDSTNPAKSFKMQIPANWTVKENFGGYAVFMEPKDKSVATAESPIAADPNISIAVVNVPKFIDERALEEYGLEIQKKFQETNGGSNEFNIFAKHLLTDLPGGKRALMYYITYVNNGVDVGSTILVMSNSRHMYRVTYTDYRVNYEKNFEKFFPVMSSLQILGSPPQRENVLKPMIPYAAGILILVLAVYLVRRKRAKDMQAMFDEASSEAFEDNPKKKTKQSTSIPPSSRAPKGHSQPRSDAPSSNPPGSTPPSSKSPRSNPPGSNPPGSNPPGSNPPRSNPGSNPPSSNSKKSNNGYPDVDD